MYNPVILIGAARSGTKFLRGVLSASDRVYAVPYDVNYVWRYGNETYPDDELPPSLCTSEISDYIQTTLASMAKIPVTRQDAILIEKSVPNSLRIDFVKKVYPDARFIHLIRDGRDVVESSIRQWQAPPDWRYLLKKARQFPIKNFKYGYWYLKNMISGKLSAGRGVKVWGPRYKGVDVDSATMNLVQLCSKQWVASVETSIEQLSHLSSDQYYTVRYEDLVKDEQAVRQLCDFLGIVDKDVVVQTFKRLVMPNLKNQWRRRMNDAEIEDMLKIIGPTLRRCGYEGTE